MTENRKFDRREFLDEAPLSARLADGGWTPAAAAADPEAIRGLTSEGRVKCFHDSSGTVLER